jgi:hypothetical protein
MGNPPVVTPTRTCTCSEPIPVVRADRKGAGRTECLRCGMPVRLTFGGR